MREGKAEKKSERQKEREKDREKWRREKVTVRNGGRREIKRE